jgi:hypothetical protein
VKGGRHVSARWGWPLVLMYLDRGGVSELPNDNLLYAHLVGTDRGDNGAQSSTIRQMLIESIYFGVFRRLQMLHKL